MYKTFTEWKNGNWLEDCEPRKEAYTKDELLLVEMGWKYGFDAGKAQQADRIAELEKYATNGNEILVDCDTHMDKLQKLVLEKDKELKRYKMAWNMAENQIAELKKDLEGCEYFLKAQTKPLPEGLIDPKSYYIGYEDGKKAPQTKPLSDEEMKELINNFPIIFSPQDLLTFARAIEERHGIK